MMKNIRRVLKDKKNLGDLDVKSIDLSVLCNESLMILFDLCKGTGEWIVALEAAKILDKKSLPRQGKIVDETGGYYSARSARISKKPRF